MIFKNYATVSLTKLNMFKSHCNISIKHNTDSYMLTLSKNFLVPAVVLMDKNMHSN
jgi:hypothetical protein